MTETFFHLKWHFLGAFAQLKQCLCCSALNTSVFLFIPLVLCSGHFDLFPQKCYVLTGLNLSGFAHTSYNRFPHSLKKKIKNKNKSALLLHSKMTNLQKIACID